MKCGKKGHPGRWYFAKIPMNRQRLTNSGHVQQMVEQRMILPIPASFPQSVRISIIIPHLNVYSTKETGFPLIRSFGISYDLIECF